MIHTNNPIIKHKAGLLNLAQELNNVSRACKVMGVSRDTFYRYLCPMGIKNWWLKAVLMP
jgi:transcriptional regulator of acetoin/glycerol metabolism